MVNRIAIYFNLFDFIFVILTIISENIVPGRQIALKADFAGEDEA